MGRTLSDRYELIKKLGSGAMADVHLARDTKLRRDVAIKILHPHIAERAELRQRFIREARAAAALDHNNILKVFDVSEGKSDDAGHSEPAFIVMELLSGQSLDEFLRESGTPLAEVGAMIGSVLADALQAAHDAGVVHRDIKPANVMIAKGGRLVVCDFGMARLSDDGATLTSTGAVMGTPAFMSPEQALGHKVEAATDVYSLGATLYHLTTGALPASGSTPVVVARISLGDVKPPLRRNPRIGQEMASLVEKMMATAVADRIPSAKEAGDRLRKVAEDSGFTDAPIVELTRYFADPAAYNATALPRIVASGIARARAAAKERRLAKSLSLADRVLALDPYNPQAQELLASFNRRLHFRTVARALTSIVLAAGVILVLLQLLPAEAPQAPAESVDADHLTVGAAPVTVGTTPVTAGTTPVTAGAAPVTAGAAPMTAGKNAGATQAARLRQHMDAANKATARASGHRQTHRSRPGLLRTPNAAAAAPAAEAPAPKTAMLLVQIRPWCDAKLDGRALGRSPMKTSVDVAPGRHVLSCAQNIAGGRAFFRTLDLRAGQTLTVRESLHSAVAVELDVGKSHVRIEKVVYRDKSTILLAPGRHMVEVLDGSELVERGWVEVSTLACTLRRRPELGCY